MPVGAVLKCSSMTIRTFYFLFDQQINPEGISTEQQKVLCLKHWWGKGFSPRDYTTSMFIPQAPFGINTQPEEVERLQAKFKLLTAKKRIDKQLAKRKKCVSLMYVQVCIEM